MKKLTLVAALTLAAPLFADGAGHVKPGNYHITMEHEMVGLPYKPPTTSIDKCVTPEDADKPETLSHHNDKCVQKQFKKTGNKLTFEVECHDRGGVQTGTGEYVFGNDHWTGTVTVNAKDPRTGMDIKMINHIESTRTGDCKK